MATFVIGYILGIITMAVLAVSDQKGQSQHVE